MNKMDKKLKANNKNKDQAQKDNLVKRWYKLCEPNKRIWFWQIFYYMIYAAIYASMTIIAAKTINCLYTGDFKGAFFWLAIEFLDILLRNVAIDIQYKYYSKHYGIIRSNISRKIYDKLLSIEDNSLKDFSTEKIINIAQNNMAYAAEFPDYIASMIRYSIEVAIAIGTIFVVNVYAGLIVAALGVVNYFVYNHLNKKMGRIMNNRYEKKDQSFQEYSTILAGKTVINELDAKEKYKERLLSHVENFNKEYCKYYKTYSFRNNIYYVIWNIIIYAITAMFIFMVSKGAMELVLYIVVVPYLTSCTDKLNTLYTKFDGVENMRVDVDRINMILSLNDKQMIQYGNVNTAAQGYNLGFINVGYKGEYAELKDINIAFKMHGVNIIKGARNCGKRYIFDMLRRNIVPDSGKILLDNLNLYDYSEKTFKNHINYCSAHPIFINGTVKENLLVTKKDFKFITNLVSELGLEEKIAALPKSYDTNIAEILDGETRFWIGLIRAALSNCRVLMIYEYPEDVTPDFHTTLQKIIATSEPEKRTLIFFTHKNDYDNLANTLYEIKNGKVSLKAEDTTKQLKSNQS